jgi:hypothetical protein
MSAESKRLARAEQLTHERARLLAAQSVDTELESGDAEWLNGHLDSCGDCAAVAEEYRAIHAELRSLSMPEPPRDLWARTSTALDRVDASWAGRSLGIGKAGLADRRPLLSTVMAVAAVVVVAVASLLAQSPILAPAPAAVRSSTVAQGTGSSNQPTGAPQAPLAVVGGTSYWISSEDGGYEIRGGTAQCTAADGSCAVAQGAGRTLASINSKTPISAVIAPDASRAAVWTKDKIVIVPLTAAEPQTTEIDQLTPRPTIAATPSAAPATATPSEGSAASASASAPAPTATPSATGTPPTSPSASASAAVPTVILSGYEIVGRDPEFSADGQRLAFSARPVDHTTGPNVFVWRSGQEQARAVTLRNTDLFAGWYGLRILISEISVPDASAGASASPSAATGSDAPQSTSYVFDPQTDEALKIGRPMLLPVVDPTGRYLVFWSGTVEYDAASGLWQPGRGDLYFDTWADLTLTPASLAPAPTPTGSSGPSAPATPSFEVTAPPPTPTIAPAAIDTPTAVPSPTANPESSEAAPTQAPPQPTLPQLLPVAAAPGTVHGWIVRWDSSGQHVAVWVADPGSARIGRLSLFSIDRATELVDTNEPLLAADKVIANIAFDGDHLVYTSAVDGKTYMQAVPAVPPSSVSTPPPATPGGAGATAGSSAEAVPASDQPGS